MEVENLQRQIRKKQELYVIELMRILRSDPTASEHKKNYKYTEEYLWELLEKDGSFLDGLLSAMETYLEK